MVALMRICQIRRHKIKSTISATAFEWQIRKKKTKQQQLTQFKKNKKIVKRKLSWPAEDGGAEVADLCEHPIKEKLC